MAALGEMSIPTDVVVSLRSQKILGKKSTIDGIEEFRGIPYGSVPGRWQHSTVRSALPIDVFDATRNGARCPQPQGPNNTATFQSHLDFPVDVSEDELDCLNLFIVRPSNSIVGDKKIPVYFYIHGGGYGFGATTDPMWDPTRLVAKSVYNRKPIVFVGINYRLNIFGFAASSSILSLSKSNKKHGCNFGLGDQHVALQWVRNNISFFGGDARRITIGGQSAGSSSVHAHVLEAKLVSPTPFFHRAIMQSGAVGTLGPISIEKASANFAMLGQHLNGANLAELANLPAQTLLQASIDLGWWVFPLVNDGVTIIPHKVGRWATNFGQESSREPVAVVEDKKPLCILVGDCDTEASIWNEAVSVLGNYEQFATVVKPMLTQSLFEEFCEVYRITEIISKKELHQSITQFLGDLEFGYPVYLAQTELRSAATANSPSIHPTITRSFRVRFGNPFPGVSQHVAHHCVDLIYIFDCFHDDLRRADESEGGTANGDLVDVIQNEWIDFIADDDEDVAQWDEESLIVYEQDRIRRVEDMTTSIEVGQRKLRFSLIEKYKDQLSITANCITRMNVT